MRVHELAHLTDTHVTATVRAGVGVPHVVEIETNKGLCGKFATEDVTKITAEDERTICGNCARRVPQAETLDEAQEEPQAEDATDTEDVKEDTVTGGPLVPWLPESDDSGEGQEKTEDTAADPLDRLILNGARTLAQAAVARADSSYKIAETLFEMREHIEDKDGDLDILGNTNDAKKRSAAMYALVVKLIEENAHGDQQKALLAEVKSTKRSVQTAMRTVRVLRIRELDHNPERAARYGKALEAFPHLAPSEAVHAWYAKQGKELPRQTPAELEADRRSVNKEEKNHKEAPEAAPADDATDEPQGEEITQHVKDLSALKTMQAKALTILKRAAESDAEDRARVKAQAETMLLALYRAVEAL
jgi:hypothetical protein